MIQKNIALGAFLLLQNLLSVGLQAQTDGDVDCLHLNCKNPKSAPAVIFGVSETGLKVTADALQKNASLLQKIISHELTIKKNSKPTLLGSTIESNINRKFPIVQNLPLKPTVKAPGLAIVLDPESVNGKSPSNASFTSVNFIPKTDYNQALTGFRDSCQRKHASDPQVLRAKCSQYNKSISGGLDISEFSLYDLDVKYNLSQSKPDVVICGKFDLRVQTDLAIGIDILDKDILVNNIDIKLQNGKKHCFKADVNISDLSLKNIRRISGGHVVARSEVDKALNNKELTYSNIPRSNALRRLSDSDFNNVVADTLAPILSNNVIQKAIETPIVGVIEDLLEYQINDYSQGFLNNEIPSPVSETKVNLPALPQRAVVDGLKKAVEKIESKSCKKSKSAVKNGIKDISWLVENNSEFSDASELVDSTQPVGSKDYYKVGCFEKLSDKQKQIIKENIATLNKRKRDLSGRALAATILTELNKVPVAGPNVSAYIPEICLSQDILNSNNVLNKRATRNFINNCQGAYSLLNMEAINKILKLPQIHKSLCTGTKNQKCEVRLPGEKESYADPKINFSCVNLKPLTAWTTLEGAALHTKGNLSFNLKVNLEQCKTKGVLGLGSIKDTEVNIYVAAKVETQGCSDGRPVCVKLAANNVTLDKQGYDSTLIPDVVISKIKSEVAATLPTLETQFNKLFLNNNLKGFEVDTQFQTKSTVNSPGVIGMCFKPSQNNDILKLNLCRYAKSAYGNNSIVASECAGVN